jgi:hypothetical protein
MDNKRMYRRGNQKWTIRDYRRDSKIDNQRIS